MIAASAATPLNALDAVIIDIETTGLDPATAWAIELGAVRISSGRLADTTFRRLINPGVPIPHATTRIHGIDDIAIAEAPRFEDVWPEFCAFAGDDVIEARGE